MSFKRFLLQDGILRGILLGGAVIPAVYGLVRAVVFLLSALLHRDVFLRPPLSQLYTLAVVIILCRFLIVNNDREATGKGMLLVTLLSAFGYFIYSFKVRHAF